MKIPSVTRLYSTIICHHRPTLKHIPIESHYFLGTWNRGPFGSEFLNQILSYFLMKFSLVAVSIQIKPSFKMCNCDLELLNSSPKSPSYVQVRHQQKTHSPGPLLEVFFNDLMFKSITTPESLLLTFASISNEASFKSTRNESPILRHLQPSSQIFLRLVQKNSKEAIHQHFSAWQWMDVST